MSESGVPAEAGAATVIATGLRGDLGALVLRAFRAAVADADDASKIAVHDFDKGVHEYRKALRRARAFLALLRPSIGRDAHDEIRDELRVARRRVSLARDHTVAAAALAQLALESQEREGANHMLMLLQAEEPPGGDAVADMRAGSAAARVQSDALEGMLRADTSLEDITEGLARTYRQARRARRDAKRSRRAFHRFRRRCKELDAQLGLLAEHAGERTRALRESYSELSATLGPIADLIMLRSLSTSYRDRHPDAPFQELENAIARLADEQIRVARRAARPMFEARPQKLAKAVRRAIEHDLETPQPVEQRSSTSPGLDAD